MRDLLRDALKALWHMAAVGVCAVAGELEHQARQAELRHEVRRSLRWNTDDDVLFYAYVEHQR